MNPDRNRQAVETRSGGKLTATSGPPPGAVEPVAKRAARFLPSSRYRHPGDVIRLIISGAWR